MKNIPIEIVSKILDYLPTKNYIHLKLIDKYFNNIYDLKIIVEVEKIQNFYKRNRIWISYGADLPYFMGYNRYCKFVGLLKRNLYYRKLVLWTDEEYFKKIPEKIISRLPFQSSRYLIIVDWINNNLVSNVQERKRSDILKFLNYNRIKIRECMRAGI